MKANKTHWTISDPEKKDAKRLMKFINQYPSSWLQILISFAAELQGKNHFPVIRSSTPSHTGNKTFASRKKRLDAFMTFFKSLSVIPETEIRYGDKRTISLEYAQMIRDARMMAYETKSSSSVNNTFFIWPYYLGKFTTSTLMTKLMEAVPEFVPDVTEKVKVKRPYAPRKRKMSKYAVMLKYLLTVPGRNNCMFKYGNISAYPDFKNFRRNMNRLRWSVKQVQDEDLFLLYPIDTFKKKDGLGDKRIQKLIKKIRENEQ